MILYIFLRLKHCKSFTWGSPQPRAQLYWREGLGHTRSQKATAGKLFFNALFCRYHKIHRFNFKHCVDPSYQTYCCVITKVFAIWRLTCFSIVFTHSARSQGSLWASSASKATFYDRNESSLVSISIIWSIFRPTTVFWSFVLYLGVIRLRPPATCKGPHRNQQQQGWLSARYYKVPSANSALSDSIINFPPSLKWQ